MFYDQNALNRMKIALVSPDNDYVFQQWVRAIVNLGEIMNEEVCEKKELIYLAHHNMEMHNLLEPPEKSWEEIVLG